MNAQQARHWQESYQSQVEQQEKQTQVTVRKKSWLTPGEKIIYTFISACLVVAGFFVVSFSSSIDSLNREVQTLERTIETQQVTNQSLEFEKKELSKPDRIMKVAEENGLKIQGTKIKRAESISKNQGE